MPLFHKYEIELKKDNIEIKKTGLIAKIKTSLLGKRMDYAQLAMDTQIWEDIQRYMPVDTGALVGETNSLNATHLGSGRVYVYPPTSPYGHYQHDGIVYKDPVYNFAGLYSPMYGWWSRSGVKKVPSTQLIKYSQPNARRYWGQYAYDHHKNQWINVYKRAVK